VPNRRVGPGSIGSSAIIGIVFDHKITDRGLHTLAIIVSSISVVSLLMTVADRQLRTRPRPGSRTRSVQICHRHTIDQHDRRFGPRELTP
jgi:hypothetical protein